MKPGPLIATGTRSSVHSLGPRSVVKIPFDSTPSAWMRAEAMYTAAVHAAGGPAPALHDLVEVDGRVHAVYERIVGPSMWDVIVREPSKATSMGVALADLHLRIIDATAPPLLPRQVDRLHGKIRFAAARFEPELLRLLALIPDTGPPLHLCHGDLHPANVIVSGDGPVAVDWFDACLGRPEGDVARTSLLLGGAIGLAVPHLHHASAPTLSNVHSSYNGRLEAIAPRVHANHDIWLRIEAAARLAEGIDTTRLLQLCAA